MITNKKAEEFKDKVGKRVSDKGKQMGNLRRAMILGVDLNPDAKKTILVGYLDKCLNQSSKKYTFSSAIHKTNYYWGFTPKSGILKNTLHKFKEFEWVEP